MADAATAPKPEKRTGRPAGYLCAVCQEAIPVLEMLNLVLSGMWSVQRPELPQLARTIHLHQEHCAELYIRDWDREKIHD